MVDTETFVLEPTDAPDSRGSTEIFRTPDAPEWQLHDVERSTAGIRWRIGTTADPQAKIDRERKSQNRKDLSPGQEEKRRSNKDRPAQHPRRREGLAKPRK